MATKVVANLEIDILKEEREGRLREVGNQAVWSLSSCKPGSIHNNILLALNHCVL